MNSSSPICDFDMPDEIVSSLACHKTCEITRFSSSPHNFVEELADFGDVSGVVECSGS
jgi:hypothetical protein